MRFITENLNKVFKTDIIVNLSAFILIIFVFINFTHNSSDPHRFKLIENNTYLKVDGYEFKKNMNDYLAADSTYAHALDKNCEVTGNMHDRHKVRWVKELFLKYNIPSIIENEINYYTQLAFKKLDNLNINDYKKDFLFDFGNSLMKRKI